jgi:predicted aspartyl protease
MNFPYTKLPGSPDATLRPLVPVRFVYKGRTTLPIFAMVDSGADYSYVTGEIADLLGIKLNKNKPVRSFGVDGSPFLSYESAVEIELGGHRFAAKVLFADKLGAFKVVLGQEDFFYKARIVFERYKWNLEITFK